MERYSEYKDSGVQWLGEIPGHWKTVRVKALLSERVDKSDTGLEEPLSMSQKYGIIPTKEMDVVPNMASTYIGAKRVFKRDLVFNKLKAHLGVFAISKYDGLVSPDYAVYTPNERTYLPFMEYVFHTPLYIGEFTRKATGVAIGLTRLYTNGLFSIPFLYPPIEEQHSIVSYLDDKCGKIDKMLEGKQKQIELLAEMKQRIIADAVTHGLNPDVKMKATNTPWLPEIPEHWEMSKVSSHFKQRNEKVSDKDYPALSVSKQGVTPQLANVALSNAEGSSRKLVKVGDYAVNSRSDRKGSCGVSKYEGSVSLITIVLEPFNIYGNYVHYLFRSNPWIEEFYRNGRGIVADLWTTNYQMMKSMYMPIPPLSEQCAIVSYLDGKTARIDILTSKLQQEIESIKEYKQRLISDVVTGQIKVS